MEDEINLIDFLRVLIRQRGLILGGTAIITVLSVVYSLWLPKGYEARARILVMKHGLSIRSASKLITEEPNVDINTQIVLLKSREIARRVVIGLGLDRGEHPMTATALLASGRLETVGQTPVIELTVSAGTAELSRDIANRWVDEFIRYNEEVYSSENRNFSTRLRKNFTDVQNKIEIQKKKISRFLSSNRKIPHEIITGKEEMILALQQKKSSLSDNLDLFTASYKDSWKLILNDALGLIRQQVGLLKRRESENNGTLKALNDGFSLISDGKSSIPVEVKIPFSGKRDKEGFAGSKKKESRFFLASSTDPVAVKLKLDTLNISVENRDIRAKIEYIESSLPEIESIFSDIEKLDITSMNSGEIVKASSSLKERLAPFSSVAGGLDIDYIHGAISNYITMRKTIDNTTSSLSRNLKEYNDIVLKSKSYELGFETLVKDYKTLSDSYVAIGQKIEEVSLREGVNAGNVKLIEAAITPEGPSTPVKRKIVTVTFILGLLFFVFIGFITDYYQREGGKINESAT